MDLGTHFTNKSARRFLGDFRAILDLSQTWSNKGLKRFTFPNLSNKVQRDAFFFTFSKLKFESKFRYPFERQECMQSFGGFRAILDLIQTW